MTKTIEIEKTKEESKEDFRVKMDTLACNVELFDRQRIEHWEIKRNKAFFYVIENELGQ